MMPTPLEPDEETPEEEVDEALYPSLEEYDFIDSAFYVVTR